MQVNLDTNLTLRPQQHLYNLQENLKRLHKVLKTLQEAGAQLQRDKCSFMCVPSCKVSGVYMYVIDEKGLYQSVSENYRGLNPGTE